MTAGGGGARPRGRQSSAGEYVEQRSAEAAARGQGSFPAYIGPKGHLP